MKNKPAIVFLDSHTLDRGDLDFRRLAQQGSYEALRCFDKIPRRFRESPQVVITNKVVLDAARLAALPDVKLVCVAATGVNNVDLEACRARGIAVCNARGYSTATVVEHTLLFLLACSHRLLAQHRAVMEGQWVGSREFALLDYPFGDLAGKALGLVGYGNIGRRVGDLAKALGMRVLIAKIPGRKYDKGEERLALKTVLQKSDFVSLHCPLSPLTEGLMNAETLGWMKPGAYLLNLARGPLVVEPDLVQALKKDRLAGYATDVLTQEPMRPGHPFLRKSLAAKLIVTPHVAWASRESRQRLVDEIVGNIAAFRRGESRSRVV